MLVFFCKNTEKNDLCLLNHQKSADMDETFDIKINKIGRFLLEKIRLVFIFAQVLIC